MPIGLVGIEALEQHISEKDIFAKLNKHLGNKLNSISATTVLNSCFSGFLLMAFTIIVLISSLVKSERTASFNEIASS
jgi:hypothetical protein